MSSLSNHTTSNLTEGSNLYFTKDRVWGNLYAGTGVTLNNGNISIGQSVGTTDDVSFGNIQVTGNISAQYLYGNGAHLTGISRLGGSDSSVNLKNYSDASFGNVDVRGNVTGNIIGNVTGNVIGTVSSLHNFTTDNLTEGSNLYFTKERVLGNLNGGTGVIFSNGNISIGQSVGTTDDVSFGNIHVTGNISAQYLYGNGAHLTGISNLGGSGSANLTNYSDASFGNVDVTGYIHVTGNISADYLYGNAAHLTGLPSLGGSGSANLTNYSDASFGNVDVTGYIHVTGNISADYLYGNAAHLTGLPSLGGSDSSVNLENYSDASLSTLDVNVLNVNNNEFIGNVINGGIDKNNFASKIAFSGDGKTLVASYNITSDYFIDIYKFISDKWIFSNTFEGSNSNYASEIVISNDGSNIFVNEPAPTDSIVYYYNYDNGSWNQTDISQNNDNYFGTQIALSNDGSRFIAVSKSSSSSKMYLYKADKNYEYDGTFVSLGNSDPLDNECRIDIDNNHNIYVRFVNDKDANTSSNFGYIYKYTFNGGLFTTAGLINGSLSEQIGDIIKISSDGTILAYTKYSGGVKNRILDVYDITSSTPIITFNAENTIKNISISNDGQILAYSTGTDIYAYKNIKSGVGKLLFDLSFPSIVTYPNSILNSLGTQLAVSTGEINGNLQVYNIADKLLDIRKVKNEESVLTIYNDKVEINTDVDVTGNITVQDITAQDINADQINAPQIFGDVHGNLTGDVNGTVTSLSNHSTNNLTEGSNLYFTDQRARAAISGGNGIFYNQTDGIITTVQDLKPNGAGVILSDISINDIIKTNQINSSEGYILNVGGDYVHKSFYSSAYFCSKIYSFSTGGWFRSRNDDINLRLPTSMANMFINNMVDSTNELTGDSSIGQSYGQNVSYDNIATVRQRQLFFGDDTINIGSYNDNKNNTYGVLTISNLNIFSNDVHGNPILITPVLETKNISILYQKQTDSGIRIIQNGSNLSNRGNESSGSPNTLAEIVRFDISTYKASLCVVTGNPPDSSSESGSNPAITTNIMFNFALCGDLSSTAQNETDLYTYLNNNKINDNLVIHCELTFKTTGGGLV